MLLLLPPSESKRDGGAGRLDLGSLSFPGLTAHRREALRGIAALGTDPIRASEALRLGPARASELAHNRVVLTSPVRPAIERYAGVLYDAIGVCSLPGAARAALGETVVIHSALFGLIGADDAIPRYRLSHDSRLPGPGLRAIWRPAVEEVLAGVPGTVIDCRSEGYRALGRLRPGPGRALLRVVRSVPSGRARALSHASKATKGRFLRDIATALPRIDGLDELRTAAAEAGWSLTPSPGAPGGQVLLALFER